MPREIFVISINPVFAEMILAGSKRIEFRKTRPSFVPGDRGVIYASAPLGKVIGVFEVAAIHAASPSALWRKVGALTPHKRSDILGYLGTTETVYGIEIAWARPLKPQPLPRGMKATQTWQFLDRDRPEHAALLRTALRAPGLRAR